MKHSHTPPMREGHMFVVRQRAHFKFIMMGKNLEKLPRSFIFLRPSKTRMMKEERGQLTTSDQMVVHYMDDCKHI